jgi:GTPase
VRDGATYSSSLNLFFGDLMQAQEVQMEVISAKQRRAARTMSGEGESQLEVERRQIRDKEARIRKEIDDETRLRKITQEKAKRRGNNTPVVALVGYTNVGKSAFLNYLMKKEEVKSRDLLFQTLSTTARQ